LRSPATLARAAESCGLEEILDVGATGGLEGGGEEHAVRSEAVAVALGDLLDDAVGAKKAELPADLGGQASPVTRSGVGRRAMDEGTEVAVSEASGCELATGDGVEELGAGRGVLDGGEGLEVRVVGTLGQLGTAMEVGGTLAKRAPFELALGLVVGRAKEPRTQCLTRTPSGRFLKLVMISPVKLPWTLPPSKRMTSGLLKWSMA
jgi:hypothetical protein